MWILLLIAVVVALALVGAPWQAILGVALLPVAIVAAFILLALVIVAIGVWADS